jgi:hypothetical protein
MPAKPSDPLKRGINAVVTFDEFKRVWAQRMQRSTLEELEELVAALIEETLRNSSAIYELQGDDPTRIGPFLIFRGDKAEDESPVDVCNPLLTEREAGAKLKKPPRTLEGWRRFGTGPAFLKLGRNIFYRLSDIEAWLAAQRRTSTSDPGAAA